MKSFKFLSILAIAVVAALSSFSAVSAEALFRQESTLVGNGHWAPALVVKIDGVRSVLTPGSRIAADEDKALAFLEATYGRSFTRMDEGGGANPGPDGIFGNADDNYGTTTGR